MAGPARATATNGSKFPIFSSVGIWFYTKIIDEQTIHSKWYIFFVIWTQKTLYYKVLGGTNEKSKPEMVMYFRLWSLLPSLSRGKARGNRGTLPKSTGPIF